LAIFPIFLIMASNLPCLSLKSFINLESCGLLDW